MSLHTETTIQPFLFDLEMTMHKKKLKQPENKNNST